MAKQVVEVDRVVIRFAGDSGDGMQLTGDRFTSEAAWMGNDLLTLPDFPAEIRAPAGTLPGVSSFQLAFADHDHAVDVQQVQLLAHRVYRSLVGGFLVAAPDKRGRGQRRLFRDTGKAQR